MKRHLILLFSLVAVVAAAQGIPHNMVSRHTTVNTNLIGAVVGEGLTLTNGVLSSTGGGGGDFLPLSGGTITDGVYSNTISPSSMKLQTEEGYITDYGNVAIYRFDPSKPDEDLSLYFPPNVGGMFATASDLDNYLLKSERDLHWDSATNIVWKNVYSNGWVYLMPFARTEEVTQ